MDVVAPHRPLGAHREARAMLGEDRVGSSEEAHLGDTLVQQESMWGPPRQERGPPWDPEGMAQKSGQLYLTALRTRAASVGLSPSSSPIPWALGGEGLCLRVWTQVSGGGRGGSEKRGAASTAGSGGTVGRRGIGAQTEFSSLFLQASP